MSPVFLTTCLSRALTYLFDATPPETTCKRYQKDLISWTPNRQEYKKRQKTIDAQWNELTIRTKWRNCIYITKYLMEGSIFNAHSIARSHLSSRCSTATRCSKFSSISERENQVKHRIYMVDVLCDTHRGIHTKEYYYLERGSNICS